MALIEEGRRTIGSTPSIHLEHPGYDSVRHPDPEIFETRFIPPSLTTLPYVLLNEFIVDTRNHIFVTIKETQKLKILPYGRARVCVPGLWGRFLRFGRLE
jgi:hypothetical protein